jgi:hypothetical protein
MTTTISQKVTAHLLALITATRAKLRDERGALNTSELLGLILIVIAVLGIVGAAITAYINGLLGGLR